MFAAILGAGAVATWGHGICRGHSSAVQDRLRNMQQLEAFDGAFTGNFTDILGDRYWRPSAVLPMVLTAVLCRTG